MVYSVLPSENVAWISCGGGNSKLATFAFSVSILSALGDHQASEYVLKNGETFIKFFNSYSNMLDTG